MEKISIIVPTRARPVFMDALTTSIMTTCMDGMTNLEVVFYIDDDDELSKDKLVFLQNKYDNAIKGMIGKRIVLSKAWNEAFTLAEGNILMHCGDDIRFRTNGWDRMVRGEFEKVPDKIVLVHGKDGIMNQILATHSFIHRKWTEVVGYFVPPYFSSDFNDTWLTFVSNELGRRVYLDNLYTEHLHWCVGKYYKDKTHLERLERHKKDNVEALYNSLDKERREDVRKLREYIESQKSFLDS